MSEEEADKLYTSTILFDIRAPDFQYKYDTWAKGIGNVAKRFTRYIEKLKSNPAPGKTNQLNVSEKKFVKQMQIAHAPVTTEEKPAKLNIKRQRYDEGFNVYSKSKKRRWTANTINY